MTMRYLYDGFLPEYKAKYVEDMGKSYEYVLELAHLPANWSEWNKKNLKDYDQVVEGCMGDKYDRKTKKYGLIHGTSTIFLFFFSEEERQLVLRDFKELVVNEIPFKTLIKF